MPFTLKRSNSIAVGTFNIYVFQPNFIGKIADLPEGTPIELETDFARPGFKARFNQPALSFVVRPDRVLAESKELDVDCGALIARMLDFLPWTPMFALGHNFVFSCPHSDAAAQFSKVTFPPPLMGASAAKQRAWHTAVPVGSATFNLQLTETETEFEISINVHLDATKVAQDGRRAFSKRFTAMRGELAGPVMQAFGVQIEP